MDRRHGRIAPGRRRAVLAILVWLGIGVFAGFSEQWLSVMVAVTGVLTFIMVFIQTSEQPPLPGPFDDRSAGHPAGSCHRGDIAPDGG